ncbi:MAG: hypothetical protein OXG53_02060 [Chloroflexi bacterium]|nr:hypothetical protein [Chloroflexota bacterium]
MNLRQSSVILLVTLTVVGYGLRVIGAHTSVLFAHDTQLVRQSLEVGQQWLGVEGPVDDNPSTYPMTLTMFLTGVYGIMFSAGLIVGAFDSASAFRDFLFVNREEIYLVAVLCLNLVSISLIPASFFAHRRLNSRHSGWLAAGFATFNLLLVHFGHQPRPHAPYASITFLTILLLVMLANRAGGQRLLIIATVMSAVTVGTLQSGLLIVVPYISALFLGSCNGGRFHWQEFVRMPYLGSIALFLTLCMILYPNFAGEYGGLLLNSLIRHDSAFRIGSQSHSVSLLMFNVDNIPQFVSRLQTYQPFLTLLLPISAIYFVGARRKQYRTLLVAIPFPLMNLIIWSLFEGTYPRFTAVLQPFMIFAAAYFLEDVVLWLSCKSGFKLSRMRALVFALLISPLALTSARLVWVSTQPDTRTLAIDWIHRNISAGETFLVNFPQTSLLPTNGAIYRQNRDFPGSVGGFWHWLSEEESVFHARYDIYDKMYWQRLDTNSDARDEFIQRAGIRYLLVRSLVSLASVEDMSSYAQVNGRLIHIVCPAHDAIVAELPDDLFYQAWIQVWQLEKPGPFVAIYDLDQPPENPPIERYCQTRP